MLILQTEMILPFLPEQPTRETSPTNILVKQPAMFAVQTLSNSFTQALYITTIEYEATDLKMFNFACVVSVVK